MSHKNPAAVLRSYLASGEIFVAPGCFDGLSARLIQQAGFNVAYASGGAISRGARNAGSGPVHRPRNARIGWNRSAMPWTSRSSLMLILGMETP